MSLKNNTNTEKFLALVLGLVLLSSMIPVNSSFAANANFSFPTTPSDGNLSDTASTGSNNPYIELSGTNIFVAWQDDTSILFIDSSDSGDTFSSSKSIGTSGLTEPKLAVEGSNVFALWVDENGDVEFNRSTNSGLSFVGAEVKVSSLTSTDPQIAVGSGSGSPDDVYAVWRNDDAADDIFFVASDNNGATFGSILDIGDTDIGIADPQIDTVGDNVYVVWQTKLDIMFARSVNNGDSFSASSDIGDSSGFTSTESFPQVAATGSFVYAAWQQGSDIKFARSVNSGSSFSAPVDIGDSGGSSRDSTPRIAISGSDVYVVWRDGATSAGDIKFVKSADNGANFGTEINLSNNSEESASPAISVSGTNVFVTWDDSTPSSGSNKDILFKLSDDNGDSFGGVTNVIENSGSSLVPSITSSGDTAFITWQDATSGINEVFFKSGTISPISVTLDESQYRLGDTATITIVDSSSNGAGSISTTVTSDTDVDGIITSLSEGPTGTFTGTISFTESGTSSGTTLKISTGDTITASFSGTDGTASIFSRTINFDGITTFSGVGSIAHVKVTDQNSNTDTGVAETVTVNVKSTTSPDGVLLVLTETGIDTGIFGGSSGTTQSDLIFTEGSGLAPVPTNDKTQDSTSSITISQIDSDSSINIDSNDFDTITVDIVSTSDATGISLILNETGINTAVFNNDLLVSTTASNQATGTILVSADDIITVTPSGGLFVSNLLVTPSSPQNGALEVVVPDAGIVATYLDASFTATVTADGASGGGGGGLVSPGLVVNALAGLGIGGGGGGGSPLTSLNNLLTSRVIDVPEEVKQMVVNHDSYFPILPMDPESFEGFDFPLVINNQGFVLGGFTNTLQTSSLKIDTPITLKFTVYTADKIQHFSLYTNLREINDSIQKSDTQILYNDGKDLQVIDPNGFFSNAKVTVTEEEDSVKKQILVDITFAKEMETSHIITRMWDSHFRSGDTHILDAIKVESGETEFNPTPQLGEEVQVEELKTQTIPKWVKNNASWWVDKQIDDESFITGIQYLINNGIMYVPNSEPVNSSVTEIPDWVRNNADWWADNQISDDDFVMAMEWLVTNGVISIE